MTAYLLEDQGRICFLAFSSLLWPKSFLGTCPVCLSLVCITPISDLCLHPYILSLWISFFSLPFYKDDFYCFGLAWIIISHREILNLTTSAKPFDMRGNTFTGSRMWTCLQVGIILPTRVTVSVILYPRPRSPFTLKKKSLWPNWNAASSESSLLWLRQTNLKQN